MHRKNIEKFMCKIKAVPYLKTEGKKGFSIKAIPNRLFQHQQKESAWLTV